MAGFSDFESLDDEIKELLENYKYKKATTYEPCTRKNFRECLIGLSEELGLYNINYIFNPHVDTENDTLSTDALVKLINAVWTLLHKFKNSTETSKSLKEHNFILEQNNKSLNDVVQKLKNKINSEKHESRACVASAQRVSDQSSELYQKFLETKAKLHQVVKQKESCEKFLCNKISKLKLENEKLTDKLRGKSSSFTPCADICDSTLTQSKDQVRKQKAIIAQLQASNQDLLHEVIAIKEELLLTGMRDIQLQK